MYGAILGDIIGSPYEGSREGIPGDFELFAARSRCTDDSVLTVAVAQALLDTEKNAPESELCRNVTRSLRKWGRVFPQAGYGRRFLEWLAADDPEPYGSLANGSAMRVSAAGWLYDSVERTRQAACCTARVTHSHPEGIRGAEAVAAVIFLARTGHGKREIREYVIREFGYDLNGSRAKERPYPHMDVTCGGTVPAAVAAFLDSEDFEGAVRAAVSLGGDTDTLACMAGAMAEAFYGIPEALRREARKRVPPAFLPVLDRFDAALGREPLREKNKLHLEGTALLEAAMDRVNSEKSIPAEQFLYAAMLRHMEREGNLLLPVFRWVTDPAEMLPGEREQGLGVRFCSLPRAEGGQWLPAFTSMKEFEKGATANGAVSVPLEYVLKCVRDRDVSGLVLNPWGQCCGLDGYVTDRLLNLYGELKKTAGADLPAETGKQTV